MQKKITAEDFNIKFQAHQKELREGLMNPNGCKDIGCIIIFVILITGFAAIGIYYLVMHPNAVMKSYQQGIDSFKEPLTIVEKVFAKYWLIILSMCFASGILSIIFLMVMRNFTKFMVYALVILSILLLLAIIVLSAIRSYWAVVGGFGGALFFMLLTLFCLRHSINRGISLLKISMQFLENRPSIIYIPIIMIVPLFIFLAFWALSLLSIQYNAFENESKLKAQMALQNQLKRVQFSSFSSTIPDIQLSNTKETIFYAFWIFMFGFMTVFLYYVMVYLMANCCGFWYYGKQSLGLANGFKKLNRFHIGSLTFATAIICFVRLLKKISQNLASKQVGQGHTCLAICLCCTSCCFSQIEQMIEVLNNYSVITMALTGQSYIQSAKTAISLVYEQFELFYISSIISQLVQISGILFSAGLPTLIGWLIIENHENNGTIDNYERIVIVVLLFFLCLAISMFFISFMSQIVGMVFIFYCLDKKYRSMGITIDNSPLILHDIDFDENVKDNKVNRNDIIPISADRFA